MFTPPWTAKMTNSDSPHEGSGDPTVSTQRLLQTERFAVEELGWRGPNGVSLRKAVVRHPGAVTILPMVDANHVCLIRNYRVAVGKTLIELPAGTRNPLEPPAETAARELVEETGYRAGRLERLTEFYLSPGILDEQMHLFLAEELTQVGPQRESDEQIENWIVEWEEALELIEKGQIEDAKTIVGLLLYDRRRRERNSE